MSKAPPFRSAELSLWAFFIPYTLPCEADLPHHKEASASEDDTIRKRNVSFYCGIPTSSLLLPLQNQQSQTHLRRPYVASSTQERIKFSHSNSYFVSAVAGAWGVDGVVVGQLQTGLNTGKVGWVTWCKRNQVRHDPNNFGLFVRRVLYVWEYKRTGWAHGRGHKLFLGALGRQTSSLSASMNIEWC